MMDPNIQNNFINIITKIENGIYKEFNVTQ